MNSNVISISDASPAFQDILAQGIRGTVTREASTEFCSTHQVGLSTQVLRTEIGSVHTRTICGQSHSVKTPCNNTERVVQTRAF